MNTVVEVDNLTKRYKKLVALDQVTFRLEANKIYGLLGRNGAGKTTLMSALTAQEFPTTGTAKVYGENPYENAKILQQLCFVRENQKYPQESTPATVLHSAPWFYPHWDHDLAQQLIKDFEIPLKTKMMKLSRGQFSAVGVTLGLASRAPLTFFDEPYLGLDAVARQIFYRRLAADYAEHPRTIVLSSHLIDEIANLVEHVLLLDHGRLVLDQDAEVLRQSAFHITGPTAQVEAFVGGRRIVNRESLGGTSRLTIFAGLSAHERADAATQNLEVQPVSLQDLVIGLALPEGLQK